MPVKTCKEFFRSRTAFFLAGILWGAVLTFLGGVFFLRTHLIEEHTFSVPAEALVRALPAAAEKEEWLLRKEACALPERPGGEMLSVFRLCKRPYAQLLLEPEETRRIAAVLPCSLAVYRTPDGKTHTAQLNTFLLGILTGGSPGKLFPGPIRTEQKRILLRALLGASREKKEKQDVKNRGE